MATAEQQVTDPKRIRNFAKFFKNYMGVSSFVVAALPVPVNLLKLLPLYTPDSGSASVITSVLCFLVLAFIFFNRHSLARRLIWNANTTRFSSIGLAIFALIVLSAGVFFFFYYLTLSVGVRAANNEFAHAGSIGEHFLSPRTRILMLVSYTAFFVLAEAAFVLMATKEYLQDLLRLSDQELIISPPSEPMIELPVRRRRGPTKRDIAEGRGGPQGG